MLSTQLAEAASERDDWQREARAGRQRLATAETALRGRELELQDARRAYEVCPGICVTSLDLKFDPNAGPLMQSRCLGMPGGQQCLVRVPGLGKAGQKRAVLRA